MAGENEKKPWGGRFTRETDALMEAYSESVSFDYQLYPYDIAGSIAHAKMLARVNLITDEEAQTIVDGLTAIRDDIDAGRFTWDVKLEDVHMNIERALTERIGPVGEKLHTARSRNDQVALDTRLYLREVVHLIEGDLKRLRKALAVKAGDHLDLYMPGYTHLQRAQPILVSHYLMAHQEMLKRDQQRLSDLTRRINVMPLGSAALAGAGLPVDMEFVAEGLGFEGITDNSLDAVADRDYLIEFLSAASIIMMHLSRFCEDLILWATSEFDFVDLPDELCTGSSIMPQKKNPDALELTRGKTGRVYGHLMGMLTVMKGLPLAYNRDLQEDKEPLFDTVHTLAQALPLTALLVEKTAFKPEVMYRAADDSFALATDLADHLVRQGVPFRRAHAQVGAAVRHCLERGVGLTDLTAEEIQKLCPGAGENVKDALTVSASAAARDNPGGTARQRVEDAVRRALEELKK